MGSYVVEFAFWIVTVAVLAASLWKIVIAHDYFSIYTYIVLGVYVPLFLYLKGWSTYITEAPSDRFYLIFVEFGVVLLFSLVMGSRVPLRVPGKIIPRRSTVWALWVAVVYAIFCLLENYLGSGLLLPALSGVDIHTYRAPLVWYVTESIYAVIIVNVIAAMCTRGALRLGHIAAVFAIMFLYVFGKAARMSVAIVVAQALSMMLFVYLQRIRKRHHGGRWRSILIGLSIVVLSVYFFTTVGNTRSNQFGSYQMDYSTEIGYTGPKLWGDWLPWYYGYFPMSFNNLNLSILSSPGPLDFFGIHTFKLLYFGVLQFDNVFGLDAYEALNSSVHLTGAAAVPTGFWDLYFDYHEFVIIPLALGILAYSILRTRSISTKARPENLVVYFFWVPMWMFMSFQSFPYEGSVLTSGFAAWVATRWGFSFRSEPESDTDSLSVGDHKPSLTAES
jgi:hypothetical protein